ncbi:hypothetical protein DPMN_096055 [Dreissena polymorpha]|uniref:Uncharacterized protein n=1 Tax=Dreissena polymorpha TaxID=45954 RepID=A0A9D4R534_DREPO|nr:hypothetical protein DPMN_096055 [Dreissena polymorpha]
MKILVDKAEELYTSFYMSETTLADAACSEILIELKAATEKKKHELAQTSKTSKLWLNDQLYGKLSKDVDNDESYWVLADAFIGSIRLSICFC